MDPDDIEELEAQKITYAYKKGHTINTGKLWQYYNMYDRDVFMNDSHAYLIDSLDYYYNYIHPNYD
jgi:hypothetical protein